MSRRLGSSGAPKWPPIPPDAWQRPGGAGALLDHAIRSRALIAASAILMVSVALAAVVPGAEIVTKRQRHAVHFTDALRPDVKLADTLEGGAASLDAGHEVVILFDGRSVTALRMNPNKANRTALDELEVPPAERAAWAERLKVAPAKAPRTNFEIVQRLADRGARVFVNRNAVRLYGLNDREIHPIAKPVSSRQVADLIDEADLCFTYGPPK